MRPEGEPPPFHVLMPVWGWEYIRLFVETALPSALAPGNLPSLPHPESCLYHIFTREEDVPQLEAAPAFRRLLDTLPVHVSRLPSRPDADYTRMSAAYRQGLTRADDTGAAVLMLTPDAVLSDGSLARVSELARQGRRAVLVSAPRTDKRACEPWLWKAAGGGAGPVLSLSSRTLVDALVRHLHPRTLRHFWSGPEDELHPAMIMWPVDEEGLLVHALHLHPLMVWPRERGAGFVGTLDEDFVTRACPHVEEIHVVRDSDEICAIELSGEVAELRKQARARSVMQAASWARLHCTPQQLQALPQGIRLHRVDCTEARWRAVEEQAHRIIEAILDRAARPAAMRWITEPLGEARSLLRQARAREGPVARVVVAAHEIYARTATATLDWRRRRFARLVRNRVHPWPPSARGGCDDTQERWLFYVPAAGVATGSASPDFEIAPEWRVHEIRRLRGARLRAALGRAIAWLAQRRSRVALLDLAALPLELLAAHCLGALDRLLARALRRSVSNERRIGYLVTAERRDLP